MDRIETGHIREVVGNFTLTMDQEKKLVEFFDKCQSENLKRIQELEAEIEKLKEPKQCIHELEKVRDVIWCSKCYEQFNINPL